jgi:WD40 repeat protein
LLSTIKDDSGAIDKQLYCLDYNNDGTKLVAAGSEPVVRVYDEVKREKIIELKEPNAPHNCHTNRVYCAKFNRNPENQNLVYTGGWDQTLIAWDLRDSKPVMSIFGPYICGDGIAHCGLDLLTASWRQSDQLQQW